MSNKDLCARMKAENMPFRLEQQAVRGLIGRIAGKTYADAFEFRQIPPEKTGLDRYILEDLEDGKIRIQATGGLAAAAAFKWYLENRCGSYVGPLTRRLKLPAVPPASGGHRDGSVAQYRYFMNYCTYGYTLVFWNWDKWQKLLDWLMLSGYNLILNPLGNEMVWLGLLQELGYSRKEAEAFLSSPEVYPWQCMMNITGHGAAAPEHWYQERLELGRKINAYLASFGAAAVMPGWCGMVPADFKEHFARSAPLDQGPWCGITRPSLLMPEDPMFSRVAEGYYRHTRELFGDGLHYFSTDPFHEGGDSSKVDLPSYARACLSYMKLLSDRPVWVLQGWQNNPIRKMIQALPPENVLIVNLRATFNLDAGDDFAHYPWVYCAVNNFGGQRVLRGNMGRMLTQSYDTMLSDRYTCVGVGMLPEGIEDGEILFDIFSDVSMTENRADPDTWLRQKLTARYGCCPDKTFRAWQIMRDVVYYMENDDQFSRESGLLCRPSLDVDTVTVFSSNEVSYDVEQLRQAFLLMMEDYDQIPRSDTYRLDMLDIAHQLVDDSAWDEIRGIQGACRAGDMDAFEDHAKALMEHYDLVQDLLCCDSHMMLGTWLEDAKACGRTPAERAYFEFCARRLITVWAGRDGERYLRDYAAREWSGLVEDFYRPRWESYLNILRRSLLSGREPEEYGRYEAEYFFATCSGSYPTQPWGDPDKALKAVQKFAEAGC